MYHLTPDDLFYLREFPAKEFAAPGYASAATHAEELACRGLLVRDTQISYRGTVRRINRLMEDDEIREAQRKCKYRLSKRALKLARQNGVDNQLLFSHS